MKNTFLAALLVAGMAVTANAATLRFDFGAVNSATEVLQAVGNYNHVSSAQDPILNAIDTDGAGTGIGLTVAGFNEVGPNFVGTQAPTGAAAIFESGATRDSLFGHSDNFNVGAPRPEATLTFSGLDASGATAYDFTFFASRMEVGDSRAARYQVAGTNSAEAVLDASNNVSNVALISGITPTASGEIAITINSAAPLDQAGPRWFYLGAMQVDSSAVIPEPTTLGMISLSGVFALAIRRSR